MKGKRKALSALVVSLIAALLIFIPVIAAPQVAEAATISPQVTYHSQTEIKKYYDTTNFGETATFTTKPYASNTIGATSDKTQKSALKSLNYLRFVAGINDNVQIDSNYIKKAQAAAFISNLNNDIVHNNPKQPNGMTKATYDLCHDGTRHSNLFWGGRYATATDKFNLNNTLISYVSENGTISDGSPTGSIGHRTYVLNPKLGKTGFGVSNIESHHPASAMYASESSSTAPSGRYVVWPAQQTPINLFSDNGRATEQWSVTSFTQKVDLNKLSIKIVREGDNKTWIINSKNTSQGVVEYIDCTITSHIDSYIKFNPKNLKPKAGEKYNVEITNLGPDTLKYSVQFFDINIVEEWKFENGIWVCYLNGKVDTSKIGLYKNPGNTWVYLNKGKQDKSYIGTSSSSENPSKQYFVRNGIWDTSYTGLAKNRLDGKWYYMENGRHNTAYLGTSSSTENPNKQYFVRNGIWDTSYTGLAKNRLDGKWYYMENGRHNTTYLGTSPSTQNPDKQYFVRNGFWDTSYTGLAKYGKNGKWYYMNKGTIDTSYIGISPSTQCPDKLFFVKGGVWETSYTGLAKYNKDGKWYYMKQGRFDNTFTGVSSSTQNPNSLFYVKGGLWQNTYNGTVKINKVTYNIKLGKVI